MFHISPLLHTNYTMAAPIPNAGIPWDQRPEYLALTARAIPPGGQTAYMRAHPAGASPSDRTAFVYGQRDVHLGNWPEVSFHALKLHHCRN